ncbi:efflux RND transporter permease subunit [Ornithinimicrobium sp. INDO-MA30-4]|uniref:efflux RND transporter permease subunit n=1 Tax=Ornithinimicrobium sp. INDO-MA30-4 TaxID=2908651 RepID=UPI001F191D3D|nr:efflux RND transporter permease subunit [Ornithinimicrobium sp. INDO-MA30-4]UJH70266.1 efflux RND transporter permease subunit [Ornithinimicrobium sp. INDO-MA30-4]
MARSLAHPVITLAVAGLVLAGTVGAGTLLKTDFIGSADGDTLTATITLPTGTELASTDETAREVEAWLGDQDEVESYQSTVGSSGGIEAVFLGGGSNAATVAITLVEDSDGAAFAQAFEDEAPVPSDANVAVTGAQQQPGSSNLEVVVSAADSDDLMTTAAQVVDVVEEAGGTDVTNNLADTVPSLRVTVEREAAAAAGLTETQIGQIVSSASTGSTVGQVE